MFENLNDVPEWDDDIHDPEEEWKPSATRDACKEMYIHWSTIMTMLNGCLREDLSEKKAGKDFYADYQGMILGDAMQVAVKIRSSEAGGIYVIRMENASIIRKNAQAVQSAMLLFISQGVITEEYGKIIRAEIEIFKGLFRKWVNTFEKDEFFDEWGLFV